MKFLNPSFLTLIAIALIVALTGTPAYAASETWQASPTDGNWVTTGSENNWSTGAATFPGTTALGNNADVATFSASGTTAITINSSSLSVHGITFGGVAVTLPAYTIGSTTGNPLYMNPSGGAGTIQIATGSLGSSTETVNAPLVLGTSINFTNNSGSDLLNIGGAISNTSNFAATITLNGTNTGANTVSGIISNGGIATSLTKSGTSLWILSGANTFSGATTLSASGGTLQLNNSLALQNSILTVTNTAAQNLTFNTGLGSATVQAVTGAGNLVLQDGATNAGGAVTLKTGTFFNTTSTAYTGVLSGTGGVTKFGTNTQQLGGADSYTGTTTLIGGTLTGNGASATSTTPFGTGNIIVDGGTLSLAPATAATLAPWTGASVGGSFTYGGDATVLLTQKDATSNVVFTVGNGTGSVLTRANNGVLVLQASAVNLLGAQNSSTANTEDFIVNGTAPANSGPAGSVNASIVGLGVTTANMGDFLKYGSNGFASDNSAYTTRTGTIATGTMTSTSEISNASATATFNGTNTTGALVVQNGITATIGAGGTLAVGSGSGQAGVILNGGTIAGASGTLAFGNAEGVIYSFNAASTIGSVISGTGGVTFAGNNALTLSSIIGNSFTGGAVFEGLSNLTFTNDADLGATSNTVTFNGVGSTGALLTVAPTGVSSAIGGERGIVVGPAGVALNYFSSGASAVTYDISGNISGTGAITLFSSNNGVNAKQENVVVFSGNNSYTGGTILSTRSNGGGELGISSEANLGGASAPITFGGGGLAIIGTGLTTLSNPLNFVPTANVTFDIMNPNNIFTLSQPVNITSANLSKVGQGTLILTGINTFTGQNTGAFTGNGISVTGGTLEVDASQGGALAPNGNPATTGVNLSLVGGNFYLLANSTGTTSMKLNDVLTSANIGAWGGGVPVVTGGGTLTVNSNGGSGTTLTLARLPVNDVAVAAAPGSSLAAGNVGQTLAFNIIGSGVTITTTTAADLSTTGGSGAQGIYGGNIVYIDSTGVNFATTTSAATTFTLTGLGEGGTSYGTSISGSTAATNLLITAGGSTTTLSGALAANSLKIASSSAAAPTLDLGTNTVTLNSGGLLYTGSDNYTIQNGILNAGAASKGAFTASSLGATSPGSQLIINQYGTGTLTISAAITDSAGNGSTTLTKAGTGTLILTGTSNTYTGPTFINGGVLSISSFTNLGTNSQSQNTAKFGGLIVNGGTLQATGTMTLDNVTVGYGGGSFDVTGGNTLTLNALYTDLGTANVPQSTGLTITGSDNNASDVVVAAPTGFLGDVNINGGTLRLGTAVEVAGYVALGGNNGGFSGVSEVNFGSVSGITHEGLQLNGVSTTVTALNAAAAANFAIVQNGNGANNNATLTILNGAADTFAGLLEDTSSTGTGTLSITKGGGGTLNLTNASNTYSGVTTITNGILNVAALANVNTASSIGQGSVAGSAADLVINGGTLQYTGTSSATSTNRLFTMGESSDNDVTVNGATYADTATIDSSSTVAADTLSFTGAGSVGYTNAALPHTLILTGSNTGTSTSANTFTPVISDATTTTDPTNLVKSGAGTWVVNGANTYTGGTAVTAGTLYANNATSSTGTGNVAVANTATLSGKGTIAPTGTNAITIASGGSVTPGGVQPTAGPGAAPNGSLSINTTGITPSSVILSASAGSGLTFALGAGGAGPTNSTASVSQLLVSGTVANIMNFNVGGNSGTSTVVTINDLVGSALTFTSLPGAAGSVTPGVSDLTEYVLIQGNPSTTYGGLTLGTSTVLGNQILGGLSLLQPTGGNTFSQQFPNAELFLDGDNIVLAVPEPGTWALMLGGLGLLVFFQRRKQNKTS